MQFSTPIEMTTHAAISIGAEKAGRTELDYFENPVDLIFLPASSPHVPKIKESKNIITFT